MQIDSDLHNIIIVDSIRVFSVLMLLAGILVFVFRRNLLKAGWIVVLVTVISLGSFWWYCHLKASYVNESRVYLGRLKEAFTDGSYKHVLYFDEHTLQKHNCDLSPSEYDQIQTLIFNGEYTVMYPDLGIAASDPIKLYFHDHDELWVTVYKYSLMEIHYRGSKVMLAGNSDLYGHIRDACAGQRH